MLNAVKFKSTRGQTRVVTHSITLEPGSNSHTSQACLSVLVTQWQWVADQSILI